MKPFFLINKNVIIAGTKEKKKLNGDCLQKS